MDRQYLKTPFYGSRRMSVWLRREGYLVNRKRVRRLMRVMGIEAIYRRPNTSRPSPENKVYPYLLRGLEVSGVNQVWMADITYIPMARGFLYLVAIMDWYSRYVLAWRLSNTLDADFCVDGLEEALRQGKPEIFNTDQGSQFTSEAFTSMLLEHGIQISMDGKGRYMDNIFVERLWRSVKYEEVYLKAYQNVPEARAGIGAYLRFYNHERPHQALGYQTPQEIFEEGQGWRCLHEQGLALPSNLETTSPVMVPTKPAEDSLNLALSLSKQWGPLHSQLEASGVAGPVIRYIYVIFLAAPGSFILYDYLKTRNLASSQKDPQVSKDQVSTVMLAQRLHALRIPPHSIGLPGYLSLPTYVSLPASGIQRISLWMPICIGFGVGFPAWLLGGGGGFILMPIGFAPKVNLRLMVRQAHHERKYENPFALSLSKGDLAKQGTFGAKLCRS